MSDQNTEGRVGSTPQEDFTYTLAIPSPGFASPDEARAWVEELQERADLLFDGDSILVEFEGPEACQLWSEDSEPILTDGYIAQVYEVYGSGWLITIDGKYYMFLECEFSVIPKPA